MKRLTIAAPGSSSGKTTFCMGLMGALVRRGLVVQPCKAGPDYIDTAYHARLCGRPAVNLDPWLLPWDTLLDLFARRGADAGISVVEGVMGLYDGLDETGALSTAEIAKAIASPVVLVIDAQGMAASAAALVQGFQRFDPEVPLRGVVFNRIGGDGHYAILKKAVELHCGIRCYGYLPSARDVSISSRHLGILPESELQDADLRMRRAAELVEAHVDLDGLLALASEEANAWVPGGSRMSVAAPRCRIAVARDKAFSFYYEDGLDVLRAAGAELVSFSPLADAALPDCDGVYIGGGFPEVFGAQLEANRSMRTSIATASLAGMPIYGECGGDAAR